MKGLSMLDLSNCDWLTKKPKLPTNIDTKPFTLSCPVDKDWDEKKNRILVIIQEVATADLKEQTLCGSTYGTDLTHTLELAFKEAQLYSQTKLLPRHYAFAVINYQSARTYHLKNREQISAVNSAITKRILSIIKELKPTHILCMGDDVSKALKPDFDVNTRGWAEELTIAGLPVIVCSTLDLSSITNKQAFSSENDDEEEDVGDRDMYASAGLIESTIRFARNLFLYDQFPLGNPHYIDVKPKWKLMSTVEQVEDMVEDLKAAPYFAFDTETTNLNRIDNSLLVMQFAPADSNFTYILPFLHKESPFTNKELKYIRKLIYGLFMDFSIDPFGTEKYIVGQNLQFDVTQIREQLKIPLITRPLWDIQNGEYLLDENQCRLDAFAGSAPKAYSLAATALRYGCDAFLNKDGFNKADRENMAATSMQDKTFLDYCALDCLIPLAIHREQLKRAEITNYRKYKNLCLIQQSANEMSAASMEHRGVLLDAEYLSNLLKKGSSLDTLIEEASSDMQHTDGVQRANEIIKEQQGLANSGGLFDDVVDVQEMYFNPSKAEHQQILFQDVLELEPVMGFQKKARDNGKEAYKLGKAFQQEHRFVQEVSLFNRISKLKKMKSAYVKAFLGWIKETADGILTGRMRPSFGFIYVVTGRSNSSKPSLQQTPSRGKESKIIKRAFIAPVGHLRLATDYSANEVRFAANISNDEAMAHPFIVARQLRKEMWQYDCTEQLLLKEMKRRGLKDE